MSNYTLKLLKDPEFDADYHNEYMVIYDKWLGWQDAGFLMDEIDFI